MIDQIDEVRPVELGARVAKPRLLARVVSSLPIMPRSRSLATCTMGRLNLMHQSRTMAAAARY